MSVRIFVDTFTGHVIRECPIRFELDSRGYEIAEILDRRPHPSGELFRVRTKDDKMYLLRHDKQADGWTILSGFDVDELMSRPGIELVPVDADVIRRAEKLIDGCEHCHKDDADIPFDWILDKVTGRSGATTDYILTEPARCPTCKHEITEKTLVEPIES
jgi:hypothetical protein